MQSWGRALTAAAAAAAYFACIFAEPHHATLCATRRRGVNPDAGQPEGGDPAPQLKVGPGTAGMAWSGVSLNYLVACGVQYGGGLHCWGSNESYQLGPAPPEPPGALASVPPPADPATGGELQWVGVHVAEYMVCGRASAGGQRFEAGALFCWGKGADEGGTPRLPASHAAPKLVSPDPWRQFQLCGVLTNGTGRRGRGANNAGLQARCCACSVLGAILARCHIVLLPSTCASCRRVPHRRRPHRDAARPSKGRRLDHALRRRARDGQHPAGLRRGDRWHRQAGLSSCVPAGRCLQISGRRSLFLRDAPPCAPLPLLPLPAQDTASPLRASQQPSLVRPARPSPCRGRRALRPAAGWSCKWGRALCAGSHVTARSTASPCRRPWKTAASALPLCLRTRASRRRPRSSPRRPRLRRRPRRLLLLRLPPPRALLPSGRLSAAWWEA